MYKQSMIFKALAGLAGVILAASAAAGPVYQPPGANLTLGDVTHGKRVLSASSNPAAAAADRARSGGKPVRGTVISGAAGLEYGNVENLFDLYNELTRAYSPSDPGSGGGPGQNPDDKPDDGINIGDILDQLDPRIQEALEAIKAMPRHGWRPTRRSYSTSSGSAAPGRWA
jgi:hypothetical protein